MKAEVVDWDDSATVVRRTGPREDVWHVVLAPDDVKVVSLEQLDDMFRLSLVDAETLVWQPGMTEWVSLREIAGLEDEPPSPPKRAASKPPSPPRRSAPPPPPQRVAPASQRVAPQPASLYADPIRPIRVVAAPALRPAAPSASFYPESRPPAVTTRPAATLVLAPSQAPIESVRPLVVSHTPYPMPRKGGAWGRFVVGVALLAGITVSLYRNGVLRDAAISLHQERLYAKLEEQLGGPPFGTPRAIEQNAASETVFAHLADAPTSSPEEAPANGQPETNVPAPTPKSASTSANSAAAPVVSLESLETEKHRAAEASVRRPAAPLQTPPHSLVAKHAAPASPNRGNARTETARRVAPSARKSAPAAPSKPDSEMSSRERLNAEIAKSMSGAPHSKKQLSTGLKAGGSEYDPLNPKL